MGVVGIDDGTHSIEFFAFSDLWATLKTWIAPKMAVWVKGRPKYDDFSKKVTIYPEEIMPAEAAVLHHLKMVELRIGSKNDLDKYAFLRVVDKGSLNDSIEALCIIKRKDMIGGIKVKIDKEKLKFCSRDIRRVFAS